MAVTAATATAASVTPKPKPRPIVRLGLYLISHSFIVSVVCYIAGILALLLLPVLAKNTYISENALMPGSANSMLSSQDVLDANRLVKDIAALKLGTSDEADIEGSRLLAQYMSDLGAEVNHHKFHSPSNKFHPLHFFSSPDSSTIQENCNGSSYALSTIGIIRAPSGDGKEAIVLVTPYNSENIDMTDAVSLAIAYAVFSLFSRVSWLAKDIIWLAADSKYGEYAPVSAWLRDYHSPVFGTLGKRQENQFTEGKKTDFFRRAGTMAAAVVIKVSDGKEVEDTLSIYAEASNGQMPNLDLINIVNYLAVHKQGLRVKVNKCLSLIDAPWIKIVGELVEFVGNVARTLNPQWKFGIPAVDYVEGTATLASSLYHQALGVPTGSHGAFRDYQVDAITLEISSKVARSNKARRTDFLMRNGRLIEEVVRSVNNLLEKFHQSFFLYLLTSPSKFVSVGVYMISFGLLVAPLPIVAASLYAAKSDPLSASEHDTTSDSWRWLPAAKQVFLVHFWGIVVSLLPYLIYQIPDFSPTSNVTAWFLLSIFSFLILHLVVRSPSSGTSKSGRPEWAMLKAVTISSTFISLCLMSVINFATAEIGALLLVPICLLAHPLKHDVLATRMKALNRAVCNITLVSITFPPITFFVFKCVFEGLDGINVAELWDWVESLWAWNSATYLYLGMGYLPCWALCSLILIHPCS